MRMFNWIIDFVIAIGIKIWKYLMQKGVNKKETLVYLSSLFFFTNSVAIMYWFFECLSKNFFLALMPAAFFVGNFFFSIFALITKTTLGNRKNYEELRQEIVKSLFGLLLFLFISLALTDITFAFFTLSTLILIFNNIRQMIPDEPPKKKKEKAKNWWNIFTPSPKPETQ